MIKFGTLLTTVIVIFTLSQCTVHSKPFRGHQSLRIQSYPNWLPIGDEPTENQQSLVESKKSKRDVRLNDYEISLLSHILQLGDKGGNKVSVVLEDGPQNGPLPHTIVGEIKRPIRMAQRSRYRNCYFSPGQCFYLMSGNKQQN